MELPESVFDIDMCKYENREIGWADENEEPTHIILMITSGNQGAFIGTVGNTVWVDNISFAY